MRRTVCLALSLMGVVTTFFRTADAAGLTLTWEPNPEYDIAGYRLYYGVLNSSFLTVDVGNTTSFALKNLTEGLTYQIYATAYNSQGFESAPSAAINYDVPKIINTVTDSDQDGLPDLYEIANGLQPNNPGDALADRDGDGASNIEEFIAGTNPLNLTSTFRIVSILPRTTGNAVRFSTIAGQSYTLEANDSFPAGSWVPITSGITGNGYIIQAIDSSWTSSKRRMYRVTTANSSGTPVSSDPAGYVTTTLLGSSDSVVSTPLFRPPVYMGNVTALGGNVLQLDGASWAPGLFVYSPGVQTNTYFVLVRGGAREGDSFTITGNDSSTVTLDLSGSSLAGVNPGDPIAIVPHWTLGTLFPGGQGVLATLYPAVRNTELIMPDVSASGINIAAGHTYYYWNDAWREVGKGTAIKNDDVVLPDMYFWVRNRQNIGTELVVRGMVLTTKWKMTVVRADSGKQDNVFSLPRPAALSLNASGLIQSGAFRTSVSVADRIDELLVFDNATPGQNRPASATYYHWNGAWRKIGAGATDVGNNPVLLPGAGFIIRAAAGADATWTNGANY